VRRSLAPRPLPDRVSSEVVGSRTELTDVRAPRVKAAKRLMKRSFREQDRAFLAEGPQAVREALVNAADGGTGIRELFVTADARARHAELMERAVALGVPVHLASGAVLGELSETVTPQGVVAVCDVLDVSLSAALELSSDADVPALFVLLAAVRDPGNAGTVLRTADAAGAAAVVFSDNSVDPYNGKCVRASAGSVFHLPIVVGEPVLAAMSTLRSSGHQVFAADSSHDSVSLDELERDRRLAQPTTWVFGNEAWGLPADIVKAADVAVRVPIYGRAESLNLAAAAAVCLYASARARRPA
jgi:RNA methyltransferase, TrmH family